MFQRGFDKMLTKVEESRTDCLLPKNSKKIVFLFIKIGLAILASSYSVAKKALLIESTWMLDLSLIEEEEIKQLTKEPLKSLAAQQISDFAISLFPLKTIQNPIDLLFKNLVTFYNMRIDKNMDFDSVTTQVLRKASEKDQKVFQAINLLFKGEFINRFRKRILKSRGMMKMTSRDTGSDKSKGKTQTSQKKATVVSQSVVHQVKPTTQMPKPITITDSASITSSNKQVTKPTLKLAPTTNNNQTIVSQMSVVTNLSNQDMCLCGKHHSLIDPNKEANFVCFHCKKRYHNSCMKRNIQHCAFCHLKKLLPNREVKKTLFVGLLPKGQKKHQISLMVTEQDISIQFKIQVRCFRLKEQQNCQKFILFPDAVNFTMKNYLIKQFTPLHRQSSLKYRRDEPFYLISSQVQTKQNKIIVTERHPSKEHRDQRIEPENHLIGIYIVEERKTDSLIREIKKTSNTTMQESMDILEKSFEKDQSEVTCEMFKVQLSCCLSNQKMRIPVRGIFCTHIQCFDLKNYLQLSANSANPRWLCPVCKKPAYQFRIDTILSSILQVYEKYELQEAIFLRSGEFKVFEQGEKQCTGQCDQIQKLPINCAYKRESSITPEELPQKKKVTEIVLE